MADVRDARRASAWLSDDPAAALDVASLLVEHGSDPGLSAADIVDERGLVAVALLRTHGGG